MDLKFSSEQEILRDSVVKFAETECPKNRIVELDKAGEYPWDLIPKMAELGWFAIPVPESHGGLEMGAVDMVLVMESLSKYSVDVGSGFSLTVTFIMDLIRHGTDQQIEKYLEPIMEGRLAVSVGQTEPFSNEDLEAVKVKAESDGNGGFVLNGGGLFIPQFREKDALVLVPAQLDTLGVTLFLVELPSENMRARKRAILGRKLQGQYEALFENCHCPGENLLGAPGKAREILESNLDVRELLASAGYAGNALTSVAETIAYAKEREQFGKPIGFFQTIAHMLADMQAQADAARLLVYYAASRMDEGVDAALDVSIAKRHASEAYIYVTKEGIHIMGGYGYMMEYDMQRYAREARIATSEGYSAGFHLDRIAKGLDLPVG